MAICNADGTITYIILLEMFVATLFHGFALFALSEMLNDLYCDDLSIIITILMK